MDIAELIGVVQAQGDLLASAADRTDMDAPIPTCPDWVLRDLLRHIGGVHRWAATIVREARSTTFDIFGQLEGTFPPDGDLVDWFRQGHAALVETLRSAPEDLQCLAFLPALSPLAFWARRQAHETGIHRADVESASGGITPYSPEVASDGIEELLFGFASRPRSRLKLDPERSVQLHATDGGDWLMRIGPDGPRFSRERDATADCTVTGTASDLYLFVWNRKSARDLDVQGDAAPLDLWRTNVQIRWS